MTKKYPPWTAQEDAILTHSVETGVSVEDTLLALTAAGYARSFYAVKSRRNRITVHRALGSGAAIVWTPEADAVLVAGREEAHKRPWSELLLDMQEMGVAVGTASEIKDRHHRLTTGKEILLLPCLSCGKPFRSTDRRKHRRCDRCKKRLANEDESDGVAQFSHPEAMEPPPIVEVPREVITAWRGRPVMGAVRRP